MTSDTNTVNNTINLTDLGNAELFSEDWGHMLRYSFERKKWLVYTSKVWEWDTGEDIYRMAGLTVRDMYKLAATEPDNELRTKFAKHAIQSESDARINAMIDLARSKMAVKLSRLDCNGWIFNCLNGTIDLKTGNLLEHKPGDLTTVLVPVNYNPGALCPNWIQFLSFLTGDNEELKGFIQRAIGYTLTSETSAQVIFMLYGLGANGKSTFTSIIRKLLSGYGYRIDIDDLLLKDKNSGGGPKDGVAGLDNKRFVLASEIPDGKKLNVGLVKDLSGEDTLKARRLYENGFEFKPVCKLWMYGNHKPVITDTTLSIWRRVKLIKCEGTIPDENRIDGYAEKYLEPELEGILAWAVDGCMKWQKEGLGSADVIRAATDTYRHESDILGDFLEDCCTLDPVFTIPKSELKDIYQKWCQDNSIEPVTQKTFKNKLNEKGIFDGKSGNIRYWRGIGKLGQEGQEGQVLHQKSLHEKFTEKTSSKMPPNLSQSKLIWDNTLESCPNCGANEWEFTGDGEYLKCPCGFKQNSPTT